jgi:hypothetical protein
MLRRRTPRSIITAIAVAAAAAALSLVGVGAASAAPAAPAHVAAHAAAAAPANPTSVRCTSPGHANPCWATTENAHSGGPYGCSYPIGVPLFLRTGGVHCLGGNDLVEISCYYSGSPTVGTDSFQDHVISEDAGSTNLTGHIPDFFINLNNNNPGNVGIHPC